MAGLGQAGVICEIMNEDGTMARLGDCQRFARKHKLKIISVEDLIGYRRTQEKLVRLVATPDFPTRHGHFRAFVYEDVIHGRRHLALVKGEISPKRPALVRVHSECLVGDVFGTTRCDCGRLLNTGLDLIGKQGGVFLYMRQVDAESALARKIESFGIDGVSAAPEASARTKTRKNAHHAATMDARTYGIGAQILFDLGVRHLHLLTNHPKPIRGLEGYGLKITRQSPLEGAARVAARGGAAKGAARKTGRQG
jgi:3,4-dihydroxy 2-butanone 4-phosphate synthase/GTP cyclohydrolase II